MKPTNIIVSALMLALLITADHGGAASKVRNVNIGSHNTFINNAAQKVGTHPVTGAISDAMAGVSCMG